MYHLFANDGLSVGYEAQVLFSQGHFSRLLAERIYVIVEIARLTYSIAFALPICCRSQARDYVESAFIPCYYDTEPYDKNPL